LFLLILDLVPDIMISKDIQGRSSIPPVACIYMTTLKV